MSKKIVPKTIIRIVTPPSGTIPLAGQIPTSRNTPPPPKPKEK